MIEKNRKARSVVRVGCASALVRCTKDGSVGSRTRGGKRKMNCFVFNSIFEISGFAWY